MLKQINQSLLRNESLQLGFGTLWNLFFNKTKNIVMYTTKVLIHYTCSEYAYKKDSK